jgi:hypothetical protein
VSWNVAGRAFTGVRRRRWVGAAAAALCVAQLRASPPLETYIPAPALAEAVRLGLTRDEAVLERFHETYRSLVGGPFLQSIEIVSEYRRAVLTAEAARRRGDTWNERSAGRALEPYRGLVTLVVRVRFNPQNTYRSIPRVEAVIYPAGGDRVAPVDERLRPSYLSGPAPPGTPVLEGTLEANFLASSLDPQGLLGIFVEGREIERIPLDFAAVR